MTARTLPSLAQALGSATDLDAALVSLAGAVAENDRDAQVALLRFDPRQGLVRERLAVRDGRVERAPLETSLEQLPRQVLRTVQDGGTFGDVGEEPPAYARLFKLGAADEGATVALRGIKVDGQLVAVLSLVEPKRVFGTRAVERVAPLAGLFELALARFHDREVRDEARKTLEEVTQRVHGEYLTRLSELERQVAHARLTASQPVVDPAGAAAMANSSEPNKLLVSVTATAGIVYLPHSFTRSLIGIAPSESE